MKRTFIQIVGVVVIGIALAITIPLGCTTTSAFQTISGAETSVSAAYHIYLDQVVTGQIPTNGVPIVSASYNDTQLSLHAAAVIASGGRSSPVPPAALAKATAFTNTVRTAGGKL